MDFVTHFDMEWKGDANSRCGRLVLFDGRGSVVEVPMESLADALQVERFCRVIGDRAYKQGREALMREIQKLTK